MSGTKKENGFVVGVGASAGGIQALKEFFAPFHDVSGISFLVNQHLPPNANSHLVQILSNSCSLKVCIAENGQQMDEKVVYVIPPGCSATVSGMTILLHKRLEGDVPNKTIDSLFTSLGKELGPKSFGIVLSGLGSDGLMGVKEIEAYKGVVLVQDPNTAEFDGMPKTIITLDHPDHILPPSQMAAYIVGHISARMLDD